MSDFIAAAKAFGRPPSQVAPPATGRVVRTAGGVFVAPLGSDARYPVGPCRGGGGVAVGDLVLLVFTDDDPWIAAVD